MMTLLSLALAAALVTLQPDKPAPKPQPVKPATRPQPNKPTTKSQPPKPKTTADEPKATVFKVRVVVAPLPALKDQCEVGKFRSVDILVDAVETENEPYHCAGKKLLPHKQAHFNPSTRVLLSYKARDSIVWYSDSHEFGIANILPHQNEAPGEAPENPFEKLLIPTLKPAKSIESGPIIRSAVNHRYKVYLSIGNRIIDPDVWCSP